MALYIKPPKGNISLNKLYSFVRKRVLFLQFLRGKSISEITDGIQREKLVDDSECLIEGTVKDKISHFVLKILCASDYEMKTFLIQSETELFMYRLEFYDILDVKRIVLDGFKQCKEILHSDNIIKCHKKVLHAFMDFTKDLEEAMQRNHNYINVPFTSALNFVKDRLYPLKSGYMSVPLCELKVLLISFFEELLTQGIHQMQFALCQHQPKDPRLSYMMRELKAWFKSYISLPSMITGNKKVILEEELNIESMKFPLCMKNLHLLLRKSHRLPHHARIQYILFLKEIGVPFQEVISLFMKEYCIPVSSATSCNHSWDDSKNRYVYSIEHLYGKRGTGKNYRAHSCFTLQSNSSSSWSEGGCPFSNHDNDNISKILHFGNMQVEDIEDIQVFIEQKKYTEACSCYLSKKVLLSKPFASNHKDNCIQQISCLKRVIDTTNLIQEQSTVNQDKLPKYNYSLSNKLSSVLSRPSDFYFILANLNECS